jgi:hypothetical protein
MVAAPEIAIVALTADISLGGVEVGYALGSSLLDHGLCLLLAPVGAQHALPAQAHLSDGGAALRLGLTLSEEDAKVFLQSEETYAVTPQQKQQLREAQRIYQSHPIKF